MIYTGNFDRVSIAVQAYPVFKSSQNNIKFIFLYSRLTFYKNAPFNAAISLGKIKKSCAFGVAHVLESQTHILVPYAAF